MLIRSLTIVLVFTFGASDFAIAEFNQSSRSIHGTAENLTRNQWELSPVHLSYGFTDSFMTTLSDPFQIGNQPSVELQYQFKTKKIILSPFLSLGKNTVSQDLVGSVGLGLGLSSGKRRQHSYSVRIAKPFRDQDESNGIVDEKKQTAIKTQIEYDYYTSSGNLFYMGAQGLKPYLGITWAFTHTHIGVLVLPLYGWHLSEDGLDLFEDEDFIAVIPLPYIYWRF